MTGPGTFAEILDYLGAGEPAHDAGFVERLFHAFQHRIPFHRSPLPRREPETVLAEFLDPGLGTSGAERAAALHALLLNAGLEAEPRVIDAPAAELRRAVSVVTTGGGELLLDATLPAALLLAEGQAPIPTPLGALSVRSSSRQWEIVLDSQGEERSLGIVRAEAPVALAEPDDALLPELFRFLPDRTLEWSAGRMQVCDPWSRLEFALPSSQSTALEGLFGDPLPEDLSPEEPEVAPSLSVFCAASRSVPELLEILKNPGRHIDILPAGTVIESLEKDARGWFWTLTLDSSKVSEEMVRIEPDGVVVHFGGSGVPLREKRIRVEARPSGSRLVSTGILSRPIPPTGPSESVRKTIVFHLASELLALAEKS